ncbi:N-acetyltransferase [Brevundimonas sp.]|uniref:GNAT family N-acetyltransferase n=1 Tax=Brevundimonas sp. TaxID=1871086 RepID=UPI0025BDD5CC|nr:N-acetyltransferase [Brevundimonas sp.]
MRGPFKPGRAMTIAPSPQPAVVQAETVFDAAAVARVVEAAFGPGHLARTAERLREGRDPAVGFVARQDGRIIGSVRLWTITIGGAPALFLGPIAVERTERNAGIGAELVAACVDWAREARASGVLLVGDPPYFERFGFKRIEGAAMPGPVDPARLLWLALDAVAAPTGPVRPD